MYKTTISNYLFVILGHLSLILLTSHVCRGASSSEGRSFAVAFSTTRSDFNIEGTCRIYITARETANVNIITYGYSQEVTVQAYSTFAHYVEPVENFRTISGIEQKAIYIESDVSVTVMLSNSRTESVMETILALPRDEGLNTYSIMSYPSTEATGCSTGATCSFYSVIPFEDSTLISISKPENGQFVLVEEVVLNRYDVYTNRTQNVIPNKYFDFTGYLINSDKPISVTSGNPCADLSTNYDAAPLWSSIPPMITTGYTYVAPPIEYYDTTSDHYRIRVAALNSRTEVTFEISQTTRNIEFWGEYVDFNITRDDAELIRCDKQCLVAQYSVNNNDRNAIFMSLLPNIDQYSNDIIFTTPYDPESNLDSFISIIYNGQNPSSTTIYLDDVDISNQAWTITNEGFSYLELAISGSYEQTHRLNSPDLENKFLVLVHGQGPDSKGYGFIAGFDFENLDKTHPQYITKMTGTFYSSTGENFTAECTFDYASAMGEAAALMIPQVNDRIGTTLCSGYSQSDISAISVSAPLTTSGPQGVTELQYVLSVNFNILSQDATVICANEIDNFLANHTNWFEPILPTLPGCPGVEFTSRYFNTSGDDWLCVRGQNAGSHESSVISPRDTLLRYTFHHKGQFETDDGTDLPPSCLSTYSLDFEQKTFSMVSQVNGMIENDELCFGAGVTIESALTTLAAFGNIGESSQDYLLSIAADETGSYIYKCADAISAYLSPHTNWIRPIIPPVAGCPALVFNPEEFTEEDQYWICS